MANTVSDTELWTRMQSGEKSALALLYGRYCKHLFNYGRKLISKTDFIEDCIHDLFVDLWDSRERLSQPRSVKFYLFRSLRRRLVIEVSRGNFLVGEGHRWADSLEILTGSIETDWVELEKRSEKIERIQKLLRDLPSRQYEALVLRYYEGFTYEEVASIMKIGEQTARNFVQRAILQLRQYAHRLTLFLIFIYP